MSDAYIGDGGEPAEWDAISITVIIHLSYFMSV